MIIDTKKDWPKILLFFIVFSIGAYFFRPVVSSIFQSDLDRRISDIDSHLILERILKKESDTVIQNRLKQEYKIIIFRSEYSKKNKAEIVYKYGIRFNDLTFSDLYDYVKSTDENSWDY
ncbi:MAG: hypothetical protein AB3N18_05120 [Allomuricauda sp.]